LGDGETLSNVARPGVTYPLPQPPALDGPGIRSGPKTFGKRRNRWSMAPPGKS